MLTKKDFQVVAKLICNELIQFESVEKGEWDKKIAFKIQRYYKQPANFKRQQAALAVVVLNDAEHLIERKGKKRYIRLVTPARYICEWEAKVEDFLEQNPEFEARKWRLYLNS